MWLARSSGSSYPRQTAMLFPIDDLLDDAACYRLLLSVLHPDGLHCPKGHPLEEGQAPHDRHRELVVDYRCRTCGKVFNLYSGTPLHAVRFSPVRLVMILRGFCQGVTTLHLSQELGVGRRNLLKLRRRVQGMALERFSPSTLPDHVVEADEMYRTPPGNDVVVRPRRASHVRGRGDPVSRPRRPSQPSASGIRSGPTPKA